jgi:hypothetical protein
MMKRSLAGSILVAVALVAVATVRGQVPVRTEILPIDSVTPAKRSSSPGHDRASGQIAGELRIPRTPARVPAVVLMHGSSGIRTNAFRWSDELLDVGLLSSSSTASAIVAVLPIRARISHSSAPSP